MHNGFDTTRCKVKTRRAGRHIVSNLLSDNVMSQTILIVLYGSSTSVPKKGAYVLSLMNCVVYFVVLCRRAQRRRRVTTRNSKVNWTRPSQAWSPQNRRCVAHGVASLLYHQVALKYVLIPINVTEEELLVVCFSVSHRFVFPIICHQIPRCAIFVSE